jgi:pimeloyl-ACP methyl ester carboxylesterase
MSRNVIRHTLLPVLVLSLLVACSPAVSDTPPPPAPELPAAKPYLLHLPGIAGSRYIDHSVTRGIKDAGFDGRIEIYDWTDNDPGLGALLAYDRNHKQAQLIAAKLEKHHHDEPASKIMILAHSGGCGLAIWALEDLPADVRVETVVMMSPAVSPGYDLTRALRHIKGHLYVFSSLADLFVLGTGTRLLGTIDGVKTDAAGRVGFAMPPRGDAKQYAKLIAMPYDTAWFKFNDYGDHIGGMTHSFGENVLEPLLAQGKLPATSMPTTMETPTGLGRELPR